MYSESNCGIILSMQNMSLNILTLTIIFSYKNLAVLPTVYFILNSVTSDTSGGDEEDPAMTAMSREGYGPLPHGSATWWAQ